MANPSKVSKMVLRFANLFVQTEIYFCPVTVHHLVLAFNSLLDKSNCFYKKAKIVHALWLAERRVCLRVCKHGCDVK